jgi:lipase
VAPLHVHEYGPADGPPLLCLHGVSAHGARYRRLAAEALPAHRVVAPDLRGHGRSPWTPPWSIEQHVEDLVGTLDAAGLERAAILGHSFGGLLAAHLAAVASDRVDRLVLLDPAIALAPEAALARAEGDRADVSWASREAAREARRAGRTPAAGLASDEDVAAHLEEGPDGRFRLRYCPSAVVAAWGEMARPQPALPRGLPTAIVYATREDYVTAPVLARLRRDVGEALVEAPVDAGHVLLWDAFEETVAVVAPFLAR